MELRRHDHVKDERNVGEISDHASETNEPVGGPIDGGHDDIAAGQHADDVLGCAAAGPPLRGTTRAAALKSVIYSILRDASTLLD